MLDVVKLLNSRHVEVVALSIAESTDSAIARIITSDPDQVSVFSANTTWRSASARWWWSR